MADCTFQVLRYKIRTADYIIRGVDLTFTLRDETLKRRTPTFNLRLSTLESPKLNV